MREDDSVCHSGLEPESSAKKRATEWRIVVLDPGSRLAKLACARMTVYVSHSSTLFNYLNIKITRDIAK